MFDSKSRYSKLGTSTWTNASGRTFTYAQRRFLPKGADMDLLVEVKTEEGDRIDLIAWRTLGNAELSWRLADASDAMNPFDLTDEQGTTVRVPIPKAD